MIEQRQSDRTELHDTLVEVIDMESGVEFSGQGLNVSGGGLSFQSPLEPPLGADVKVTLTGPLALKADMRVTRVEPREGRYAVAGTLSRLR